MNTQSQKMHDILTRAGLHVLHGYIGPMGTGCWTFRGYATAESALHLLGHAFKVKGPLKSSEPNKDNKGTCLRRTMHTVYRVYIEGLK